jgi:hypothetical protein
MRSNHLIRARIRERLMGTMRGYVSVVWIVRMIAGYQYERGEEDV